MPIKPSPRLALPLGLLFAVIASLPATAATLTAAGGGAASERPLPATHAQRELDVRVLHLQGVSARAVALVRAQLEHALVGRTLTRAGLQQAISQATASLRGEGFLVGQVYASPEQVAELRRTGVLNLTVFPGQVGALDIHNTSQVETEELRKVAVTALCPTGMGSGCDLMAANYERMTQLLQAVPGVELGVVQLSPRDVAPGQTRMRIEVGQAQPRVQGSVQLDNQGAAVVGRNRTTLSLLANNLLHRGDELGLTLQDTARNDASGSISLAAPLGSRGLRWTLAASRSQFSFGNLNVKSTANTLAAGLQYPFERSLQRDVTGSVQAAQVKSRSSVLGYTVSDKTLDQFITTLSADSGPGVPTRTRMHTWSGSVALTVGHVSDPATLPASFSPSGSYAKVAFQGAFNQLLSQRADSDVYWSAVAHGQWANRNLDPSEKMGIGGPQGVRAYPIEEGSFDQGLLATFTLAARLPTRAGTLVPNAFVDAAWGQINHAPYPNWQVQNGYVDSQLPNTRSLADFGLGLSWLLPHKLSVSVVWAHKMPGSPSSAIPQQSTSRFWLAVQAGF